MSSALLAWSGAIAVGVSLGLFGSGGSILTVPVLIYLFGQSEKVAIAGSLLVVGTVALAGAAGYARAHLVDLRRFVLLGLPSIAGSYCGAWLAQFLEGLTQLVLFALVMLAAAYSMLRPARDTVIAPAARAPWQIAGDGILIGMVTGLVGVGGGFLIIPALVVLGGLTMQRAVATSLPIIAVNSYTSFLGYALHARGLALDWRLIALVTTLGVAGSFVGRYFAGRLPQAQLRRYFACFVIAMALFILARSVPRVVLA